MQKLISIRRLAILILMVAAGLLVIGGGSHAERPLTKQVTSPEGWTVQSLPPATIVNSLTKLTPISAKILADTVVEVTLRNDYDKDVTAVAAYADRTFYYREYLVSETEGRLKLASGATDTFLYSKLPTAGERLRITAVVFTDGASDGDKQEVQWMLDSRRGKKIQLLRMLPHIQRLAADLQISSKASSVSVPMRFATLKSVAESLPIKTDDDATLSKGLESGLTHGRAFILRYYVSELEEALANEKVETWYDFLGEKQTLRYSPDEHFRMKFEKAQESFMALLHKF